MKLRNNLFPL